MAFPGRSGRLADPVADRSGYHVEARSALARRPRRVQTTHAEVSALAKPPADPRQQAQRDSDAFDKAIQRAEAATKNQPRPAEGAPAQPVERDAPKVGRNDPCPCGSGKKYKKCCGAES